MTTNDSLTERQLLERLSIATQAAGIFVWLLDWKTNQISWDDNRLSAAASNRHYGQELGSELFKFVHPEDLGIGHSAITEALAKGSADASFRYRLKLADGSIRHIQAYARTMTDEQKQPSQSLGVSWDITREVEADEQLRSTVEHERKLLQHLSLASDAVGLHCWEYDYGSESFTWFYGLAPKFDTSGLNAAEAGRRLLDAILPEDRDAVHSATVKALEAGEQSMTTRMRRRTMDGQVRHLQLYQRFSRDQQGRPTHAIGATRDITAEVAQAEQFREQAEQLRDAQRRLERASLSIHEGHWEMDLISGKHWASSSYYALLGYRPQELPLDAIEQVAELIHPDDRQHSRDMNRDHLQTGAPNDHELRLRLKDGSYRWFRVRGVAERDSTGRPLRVSGSIQDIQKQKLVEDELREARLRFERAIRGTQDGLWEWDIGQETLWVSPRYEAILGYREGEVSATARTPSALVHKDDLPVYRSATRDHFEHEAPFDVEVRMRTRSGAYRWMRVRGEAQRGSDAKPLRLAGSIQDVTGAREARDALIRASEAAQAANRSKSAFLANVSHEIRTPMNGIIGMTSLLLDTSLDPAQRDFAETIRASANSLLTVINDILDFSKIEAGKLDIESIEMSLSDNINEVLAMLSFQSAAKNLRLGVDVEADVPRRVLGDPQRIRQCLINLISNAIKFTPSGEVVAAVSVAGRQDGRVLVRFEVRDTGIGIEPETLRTLFQPFVQADSSTTRHFGGTGLGLSIVRRLVEMMGGEVGVESVPGRGSRFWFLLPLPVVDAAQIGATSITVPAPVLRDDTGSHPGPAASGFGKNYAGRVLLVEDNPVNQKVARIFLERLGCEVTLAGHGMDAVTAFTADKFDLVLLDLQMPIMDGYTATGRLRELEPPGTRTPIVALTASAMSGQRERCLAAGMDELLTKPLDVERLREVLDRFNLRVLAAPAVLDDRAIADLVASGPPQEPLDLARLQALVGRDNDFAADLAETFRTTSRALLNELRACAERNDREGARRAAHSLKGASANIHAPRLRELATQLEIQASTLADAELAGFLTGITTETERVISALERFAPRGGQAVAAR